MFGCFVGGSELSAFFAESVLNAELAHDGISTGSQYFSSAGWHHDFVSVSVDECDIIDSWSTVRQHSQLSVNPKYCIFKNKKRGSEDETKRLMFRQAYLPQTDVSLCSQWPLSASYLTPHPCQHHSAARTHVDPTVSTSVRQTLVTWKHVDSYVSFTEREQNENAQLELATTHKHG